MDWADKEIKRALSIHEKSTVLPGRYRALIMAGEPPKIKEDAGEVKELIDIGYDSSQIVIVENQEPIAERLYSYYGDRVSVHYDRVESFLQTAQSKYEYMHLDFCGHLSWKIVEGIQSWMNCAAPHCRIRVSLLRSRKKKEQVDFEKKLFKTLYEPLVRIGGPLRVHFDEMELTYGETSAESVGMMWLANLFFGMNVWDFADAAENKIPIPQGNHLVTNVRKYDYLESGGRSPMSTIWCDLVPFDKSDSAKNNEGWIAAQVASAMIPIAEGPTIFKQDEEREV